MKLKLFLFGCAAAVLIACGGNKSNEKQHEEVLNDLEQSLTESSDVATEENTTTVGDKAKNCDEFLDGYEKWILSYLDFLEQYLKDPTNAEMLEKYTVIMQEASSWTMEWTNMYACSTQEKYQKRFDEISEKADKKMEELGLN